MKHIIQIIAVIFLRKYHIVIQRSQLPVKTFSIGGLGTDASGGAQLGLPFTQLQEMDIARGGAAFFEMVSRGGYGGAADTAAFDRNKWPQMRRLSAAASISLQLYYPLLYNHHGMLAA